MTNNEQDLEYFKNKYENVLKEHKEAKEKLEEQKNKLNEKIEIHKKIKKEKETLEKIASTKNTDMNKMDFAQANLERLKMQIEDHLSTENEIKNLTLKQADKNCKQQKNIRNDIKSENLSFIISFSIVVLSYIAFSNLPH